jgi:hypothetical protein
MNDQISSRQTSKQGRRQEDKMIAEYTGTIPKRGDRVSTAEQEGVFEVADINSLVQTANLKSTDGQGRITRNVPWTALKFLNKN